jgi:PAP2 superfamily
MHRRRLVIATGSSIALGSLVGCGGGGGSSDPLAPPPAAAPNPPPAGRLDTAAVAQWSSTLEETCAQAKAAGVSLYSTGESRIYAAYFAAIHDALNAIDRRYQPYLADFRSTTANPDAAVAAAAREVLTILLPAQATFVETRYTQALSAIAAGTAKDNGITVGRQAAQAILATRANDGAGESQTTFVPSNAPGAYQVTPNSGAPVDVKWGDVRPFAIQSAEQFNAAITGPYPLSTADYSEDFRKVFEIGGRSSTRSADQTSISNFWLENSPPGWNRIASTVAASRQLNGWDQARMYALLHISLADGLIACLKAKYSLAFWRPITAIRAADTDGNAATAVDATWEQLAGATPPTPDYPSAHAVAGGAAESALISIFGAGTKTSAAQPSELDGNPFTVSSPTLAGQPRTYRGFSHAAKENAESRIYVGFHFPKAVYDGLAQGRAVGDYVVANRLRPV